MTVLYKPRLMVGDAVTKQDSLRAMRIKRSIILIALCVQTINGASAVAF